MSTMAMHIIPSVLLLFLSRLTVFLVACQRYETNTTSSELLAHRRLQISAPPRDIKKMRNKQERASKLLTLIKERRIPEYFKPDPGVPPHNPRGPAVFTVAMNVDYLRYVRFHHMRLSFYVLLGMTACSS